MYRTLSATAAAVALAALPATAAAQTDIQDGTIDGVPFDEIGDSNPRLTGATDDDLSEMPISDILNEMSRRGYARYDRVERVGSLYRFHAVTQDFQQVIIEVDPIARTIREIAM